MTELERLCTTWQPKIAIAANDYAKLNVFKALCYNVGLNVGDQAAALDRVLEIALAHNHFGFEDQDIEAVAVEFFVNGKAKRDDESGIHVESYEAPQANGNGAHVEAPVAEPWTAPAMIWRDPATIPQAAFLYGHIYARTFVSATIADGGIGKSLLKIAECLVMASGVPFLGVTPTERVRVLYWNGDDPLVEVERRIHAVAQHYQIDLQKLLDERWLFVGTRDKQPLCIARMIGRNVALNQSTIDSVCAFLRENDIGLACFDPLRSAHKLPENSNDDMDVIGDAFNVIAERTNVAIGLDHHIRKMAFGQADVTVADARGASALINKVRLSRVLNLMNPALALQANIKEDDRRRYFRADGGKTNIAPPSKATWFKIIAVPCANGQDTPVVAAWTFPNAFDIVTPEHLQRIRTMAAEGSYRKNSQANDWIGNPVAEMLKLDPGDEGDRKQVLAILKTWFANGVLDVATREDEHRKKREFVVPGKWTPEEA